MSIKIDIPSYLQPFTNNMTVIEVNGNTVGECLNQLVKQFPGVEKMLLDKNGKLLSNLGIYINGEDAHPDEMAKAVKDGDELNIPYLIVGG